MLDRVAGVGALARATAALLSDGELVRSLNGGKRLPLERLQSAYFRLESDYRENAVVAPIDDFATALSYVAVRMNPIYSVLHRIFSELRNDLSESAQPESVLDIGSGPGTALFAAGSVWEGITRMVAVERQATLISVARALVEQFQKAGELTIPYDNLSWECTPVLSWVGREEADLSVVSYMLGELSDGEIVSCIDSVWRRTRRFFVVVEPGTMKGFARLAHVRRYLISRGAEIVAPCGGNWECQAEWCHFSDRVTRTRLHQSIKDATLGYEDEHYSYLVASREVLPFAGARIVGRVRANKFQTVVPVCSEGGALCDVVFPKRTQAKEFKEAKRWHWGGRVAKNAGDTP
jgi:ribosomal protein RSM22 (predicted rRNA methylase)